MFGILSSHATSENAALVMSSVKAGTKHEVELLTLLEAVGKSRSFTMFRDVTFLG